MKLEKLEELRKKVVAFRDEREWKQFYSPKELAIALAIEAGELLEHFRFKSNEETLEELKGARKKEAVADEIGDCAIDLLLLCDELGIDLVEATNKKLEKTKLKYPVEKSKGKNLKWTAYA